MKVYSYVIREDSGFAPNPFWDYCTLASTQALVRQIAKPGDWIVGLKENSQELEDHHLVFAMLITEKMSYEKYWYDPRFQVKQPDFSVEEEIFRLGDNFYEPHGFDFVQHYSKHSRDFFDTEEDWIKQKHRDLQGKYVLISDKEHFHYFGAEPAKIPSKELIELLFCDIGHKCIADPKIPSEFLELINEFKKIDAIGLVNLPFNWPKDDESWKQCEVKEEE
ncbi:MAG: hypothetical protein ACTSSH_02380 [Candidatus Heimdallarchaeota archaeon]